MTTNSGSAGVGMWVRAPALRAGADGRSLIASVAKSRIACALPGGFSSLARALASASGAHQESSTPLDRLIWISRASSQAVMRSRMSSSSIDLPSPDGATTRIRLAPVSVIRGSASGSPVSGSAPMTIGTMTVVCGGTSSANGASGS